MQPEYVLSLSPHPVSIVDAPQPPAPPQYPYLLMCARTPYARVLLRRGVIERTGERREPGPSGGRTFGFIMKVFLHALQKRHYSVIA